MHHDSVPHHKPNVDALALSIDFQDTAPPPGHEARSDWEAAVVVAANASGKRKGDQSDDEAPEESEPEDEVGSSGEFKLN